MFEVAVGVMGGLGKEARGCEGEGLFATEML